MSDRNTTEAPDARTFDEIMGDAAKWAARREALCRVAHPCPKCGTDQVQLRLWTQRPAEWVCRESGHRWENDYGVE